MILLLRQLHQEIGNKLKTAGIEQPRREAALILAHCLQLTLAGIYTASERPVDADQAAMIRAIGEQRAQHLPLAYLLGETEFYNLQFHVGPGVLIPRPDSEILVEAALRASDSIQSDPLRILDICTGTGCIGISLAVHLHQKGRPLQLWLTDLDPVAAEYAQQNLVRHLQSTGCGATCVAKGDEKSQLVPFSLEIADLFPADPALRWDLIVANPPYIASPVLSTLMPEVRCHEPLAALDGGVDGLDYYRRLTTLAFERLNTGGCLLMEHGYDQGESVSGLIQRDGRYELISTVTDYGGQPRVSGGWKR